MDNDTSAAERRKYITAWNRMMVSIWKEQIVKLRVIRTGNLYNSVISLSMNADEKCTSVSISHSFATYGIYVNYGTGSNTPRGNPGDIGRDNPRRKRKWFSTKHYSSVMALQEFWADNLGNSAIRAISNALSKNMAANFVI